MQDILYTLPGFSFRMCSFGVMMVLLSFCCVLDVVLKLCFFNSLRIMSLVPFIYGSLFQIFFFSIWCAVGCCSVYLSHGIFIFLKCLTQLGHLFILFCFICQLVESMYKKSQYSVQLGLVMMGCFMEVSVYVYWFPIDHVMSPLVMFLQCEENNTLQFLNVLIRTIAAIIHITERKVQDIVHLGNIYTSFNQYHRHIQQGNQ